VGRGGSGTVAEVSAGRGASDAGAAGAVGTQRMACASAAVLSTAFVGQQTLRSKALRPSVGADQSVEAFAGSPTWSSPGIFEVDSDFDLVERVKKLREASMVACLLAGEENLEAVEACKSLSYQLQAAEQLLFMREDAQGYDHLDSDSY